LQPAYEHALPVRLKAALDLIDERNGTLALTRRRNLKRC
jgi:hypothetical protein